MEPEKHKSSIDPVVVVALGVVLVAIALAMILLGSRLNTFDLAGGSGAVGGLIVAFLTGLTTGGLSCLAVQGGLLASSLAHQIEQDYLGDVTRRRGHARDRGDVHRTNSALPILLFLGAKLVAYTLLGALLGLLGSFLTLSPMTRALLMIAIGIFMVGNALRMFNIHPLFRYFSIEPPKVITRYMRRTAKGTEIATPIFLGMLTVFIPCGVTQAMMAAALATGSLAMGAALMFAFVLGTSPVFFIVAYLATELGARLEKMFMRFAAAAVLVLGFVTLNGGLNLIGSPLSFENLTRGLRASATAPTAQYAAPRNSEADGDLILQVKNSGYFPATLLAPADKLLTLNLVTDQTYSCARDFVIPELGFYELLPDTGSVQVQIPPQAAGAQLFFTCSMGMYTGVIRFE